MTKTETATASTPTSTPASLVQHSPAYTYTVHYRRVEGATGGQRGLTAVDALDLYTGLSRLAHIAEVWTSKTLRYA